MLPFSKRPPAPEEYFLHSGDFQALPPAHANPSIPPPPQAPIFARQRQATPYGFVQQYGDNLNSVPPPANSLAPVAMGSYGGGSNTGSHQPQVTLKEKPSLKWGLMIALTGAVLGGVIGVGMDAKRQQAAASASQQSESAPAVVTPVAAPLPAPLPVVNTIIAKPAGQPVVAQPAVAAGQPVVIPPQPPVIIGSNAKDAKPAAEPKPETKKPVVGRRFVGHSAKPSKPAEEREEAPAPVVKKPAPAPEKPAPAPAPEQKKAPAAKTDAQKVLEEAVKNTANTL